MLRHKSGLQEKQLNSKASFTRVQIFPQSFAGSEELTSTQAGKEPDWRPTDLCRPNVGNALQDLTSATAKHNAPLCAKPASEVASSNSPDFDIHSLFRFSSVITVFAQVENWKLSWGGQIRCNLRLSIGVVSVTANRESPLLNVKTGDWVMAKLLLQRGIDGFEGKRGYGTHLLNLRTVEHNNSDPTTAWLPTVRYYRHGHMRRLRQLLSKMNPGLQALFMTVMLDERVQREFFMRIAATDHHTYPGGHFDQSVAAAEMAFHQRDLTQSERGLGALGCLLFDIGKVADEQFHPDRLRGSCGLEPHQNTSRILRRPLENFARFEPALVESVRKLLSKCDWVEWLSPPGIKPSLKQCVHQALQSSWEFEQPAKDFLTNRGEQA